MFGLSAGARSKPGRQQLKSDGSEPMYKSYFSLKRMHHRSRHDRRAGKPSLAGSKMFGETAGGWFTGRERLTDLEVSRRDGDGRQIPKTNRAVKSLTNLRRVMGRAGPPMTGAWGALKVGIGVGIATAGHFVVGGAVVGYGLGAIFAAYMWRLSQQPIEQIEPVSCDEDGVTESTIDESSLCSVTSSDSSCNDLEEENDDDNDERLSLSG